MRWNIIFSVIALGVLAGGVASYLTAGDNEGSSAIEEQVDKILKEFKEKRSEADAQYCTQLQPYVERLEKKRRLTMSAANKKARSKLQKLLQKAEQADDQTALNSIHKSIEETDKAAPPPSVKAKGTIRDIATRFEGHYYIIIATQVDWYRARKMCKTVGGHLVYIETPEELAFLLKRMVGIGNVWVGATDEHKEGDWRWLNKKPVRKFVWHDRQPDGKRRKNFGVLFRNGLHDAADSSNWISGFICEWDE